MIYIISKLHDIADKLSDINHDDMSDAIDKIASFIMKSYKMRIERQRKARGQTKARRKQKYKRIKQKIKVKQKIYRKKTKVHRKRRERMLHYKRMG